MLAEYDMAGLLAAETVSISHHVLINILIADRGLFVADSLAVQRLIQTEIGHDGGNHLVIL